MTRPPTQMLASALSAIEELGSIDAPFAELDPTAPAAVENVLANSSGIDPEIDLVSIQGAWLHLHLKLQAAREHLAGGLYLLGSDTGRTFLSSVHALARIALEASAVSLWLCSNTIRWDERLRRFSQLHLKATYTVLKATGIDPRNPPDPSTVDKDTILSIEDCHTLIDWVKARGWTCRRRKKKGKEPTIQTWIEEVPTYSDLMNEASLVVGLPPKNLRLLYSVYSNSVHANPVTVMSGSSEAELARLDSVHGAIATTVAFYGRAWIQFASWCGVPCPSGALENIFAVLREGPASDRQ